MKYLVINIKDIVNILNEFDCICTSFDKKELLKRSKDIQDLVCVFGLCKLIRNKQKLILKCENAIIYDFNCNKLQITVKKLEDHNEVLFWMRNRDAKDEKKNSIFNSICDMIEQRCIQETTKEGYEQCLGPEIGENITNIINRAVISKR